METEVISALQIGKIVAAVETIETATTRITAVIYDPHGLIERAAKLEEAAVHMKQETLATAEFREQTLTTLNRIEMLIQGHHADKDLHNFKGLVLKLPVISGMFLFVAFIHTIIPPTLNLWQLVEKILGL
jgi:hypothetical protein